MDLHNPSPSIPTPVSLANGGLGASNANVAAARTTLSAAASGVNTDITKLTALAADVFSLGRSATNDGGGGGSGFRFNGDGSFNCYMNGYTSLQVGGDAIWYFGYGMNCGQLQVNFGSALKKLLSATATLDFPSTLAQTSSDLTMTVTGAALGDVVDIGVPNGSIQDNSSYFGWVSATDTVTVRFLNAGVLAKDPASGTFRAIVWGF